MQQFSYASSFSLSVTSSSRRQEKLNHDGLFLAAFKYQFKEKCAHLVEEYLYTFLCDILNTVLSDLYDNIKIYLQYSRN